MHRLINLLKTLAVKFGRPSGELVEIAIYLKQEELAQMAVARRESVSTALNSLRRRGIELYPPRGHLFLDMGALDVGRSSPKLAALLSGMAHRTLLR